MLELTCENATVGKNGLIATEMLVMLTAPEVPYRLPFIIRIVLARVVVVVLHHRTSRTGIVVVLAVQLHL